MILNVNRYFSLFFIHFKFSLGFGGKDRRGGRLLQLRRSVPEALSLAGIMSVLLLHICTSNKGINQLIKGTA